MKSITSLALIVGAVAVSSVNGSSLLASVLRPRGFEELWGGNNITAAALEIQSAISPSCNATTNCQQFQTDVVPRCMKMQGTAGCWCSLHDPLHYCAICMSNPTDNTTTADQTQAATEGHGNYHRGCAAYQNYLNEAATGSSSAPLPTGTSGQQTTDDGDDHGHGMSTGAIVGIAVGGVAFLAVIVAGTILIYRCLKNQSDRETRPAAGAAGSEKRQDSMPLGDPVRVTSYFGGTDMGDRIPHTPPPPMPYGGPHSPAPYTSQPYSPPIGSAVPLLESMAARPDSMYTTAQSQATAYNPAMHPASEFGGSSQGGSQQQQMYQQQSQYHVANDRGDAPPPFSPHPQGYDTSLLVGLPASSSGNEKARYQGSPQP